MKNFKERCSAEAARVLAHYLMMSKVDNKEQEMV